MADLSTTYTLTTPGGTVTFNGSTDPFDATDKYWIHNLPGLDGPDRRAPVDPVPFGHGSIVHSFWNNGMDFNVEGVLIVNSVSPWGSMCQQILNGLENSLKVALESIKQTTGTFAATYPGVGAKSLSVYSPSRPNFAPIENFALRSFEFRLLSETSSW